MSDGAHPPMEQGLLVPFAVLEATRALIRADNAADARRIAETLVHRLGGGLVSADTDGVEVIPADISFGDGEPLMPAAVPGSEARALLERHLTPFLLDARHVLERSVRTERLAKSASTDVLTGLPNRRMIDRALGRLAGDDTAILLDLDNFKRVNDEFGHAVGDEVLRAFGGVLRDVVRARDLVGRFGGEEFVAVLRCPVSGADAFLQRVRTEWLVERPLPVTFSAGIARSVGDPDETIRLADQALYLAKDAGRDRWLVARSAGLPADARPRSYVQPYLAEAVLGNRRSATNLAIDLLDNQVPLERIVEDLLGAAQREIGDRWQRNELSPADEHLATGVAVATLEALTRETGARMGAGRTVITCAEGDWHSLAAQVVGESLRSHGMGVTILGASTPADVVGEFLARSGGDALAISCSVPIFFPGAVRLADAAHGLGIPVIMGGRAFGADSRRALHLGADAWAPTADEAAVILTGWYADPPAISPEPTTLHPVGRYLVAEADALGGAALADLATQVPAMADYDERQLTRTREDLVFIVQFLAAATFADDPTVFTGFLTWLRTLLAHRGVPVQALLAGLDTLRTQVERVPEVGADTLQLLDAGVQLLLSGQT
jgi:diguanylate cyclase (GGDEF)-like protein